MLQVYNTLSKKKENFIPLNGNKVNIFVCGPTVYDFPHLGHAKTYTQFDFIVRYLRYKGFEVFYLQNITDIDDKIIDRALKLGIDWKELSLKYEEIYIEDMTALQNTSVNKYARATEYMDMIMKQIKDLVEKGYAYNTTDGIYYEVSKFDQYGKLSGRTELKENDSLSRIDEGSHKRGWNDFCLWKKPKENDPFWESEFGIGRPGWHIEDTAITEKHFGPQYDIHGGAIDLIFPHHECEIAQMEAASGKEPLVKYWLHTGFLNIDAQKMSKSTGNFKTIRDVLKEYNYRIIRYFILSSHYRATVDLSVESLGHAKNALQRIDNFIFGIKKDLDDNFLEGKINDVRSQIMESLDNDFNTPEAFSALFGFIRQQNSLDNNGIRVFELFKELNSIFGNIFQVDFETTLDEQVESLIEKRNMLRNANKFQEADLVRTELKDLGIEIIDTKEGVKWKKSDVV